MGPCLTHRPRGLPRPARFGPVLALVIGLVVSGCVSPPERGREDAAADEPTEAALPYLPERVATEEEATVPELVVLVHGLGRSPRSMRRLAGHLEEEGYTVFNWGYESFSQMGRVERVGPRLAAAVAEQERVVAPARIHFIGHSLGSIIIRWVLAHRPPERMGRVVMIAPPNQGSRMADRFAPLFSWVLPALSDLETGSDSTVRALPGVDGVEIGIVAGSKDYKVSVAETHLPGEADHVVVDSGHTGILYRDAVHALCVQFLREGRFSLY